MNDDEKEKSCTIFVQTWKTIQSFRNPNTRLELFEALCAYSFTNSEPEFPDSEDGDVMRALWSQLKFPEDRKRKRSKINSLNAKKRNTANISELNEMNTVTITGTNTDVKTASSTTTNISLQKIISSFLERNFASSFSPDLVQDLESLLSKYDICSNDAEKYLEYVLEYSKRKASDNPMSYFYKSVTQENLLVSWLQSKEFTNESNK
ncbi:hypothetical protein SAMN02745152_01992 [Treponema berlinense]|uniref:Uncharacterized protein n=1 Tax=Treponema berlinense TaxID=225004 RepID=A0A1T4QI73_9SPIR|nr:hypothetical protein [Treponema berlinense]SKA03346.1 hypothetical protein SAMN02745152_01992 [Treponema berlinense]